MERDLDDHELETISKIMNDTIQKLHAYADSISISYDHIGHFAGAEHYSLWVYKYLWEKT